MMEPQVEITNEDVETLINTNADVRAMLVKVHLERVVREQADEIRRLNEQISGMEGKDDAESG